MCHQLTITFWFLILFSKLIIERLVYLYVQVHIELLFRQLWYNWHECLYALLKTEFYLKLKMFGYTHTDVKLSNDFIFALLALDATQFDHFFHDVLHIICVWFDDGIFTDEAIFQQVMFRSVFSDI